MMQTEQQKISQMSDKLSTLLSRHPEYRDVLQEIVIHERDGGGQWRQEKFNLSDEDIETLENAGVVEGDDTFLLSQHWDVIDDALDEADILTTEDIREMLASLDLQKYGDVLENIIEYERTATGYDKKFGWEMSDIRGMNGGMISQLLSVGLIDKGHHTNKYRCYKLTANTEMVEDGLHSMQKKEEGGGMPSLDTPVVTDEDTAEFQGILNTQDALEYWHRYIAPAVQGHTREKKLVLIMLASPDDTKRSRGRIHLLFEGEPGTSKSMFREFVTYEIGAEYASQRSTKAGLTVNMRTGELGAMPRAHNNPWGALTLEELLDWERSEREMLKESMDSGKFPVQGGDDNVEQIYDAQIRVLACTNEVDSPKFSPQFLDRFDVQVHFERPTKDQADPIIDKIVDDFMVDVDDETDTEKLKKYLWWVKQFHPTFGRKQREEAKLLIKLYKDSKYKDGDKVNLRTSVGSILRLTYTIARLNHRAVDPVEDVTRAIGLADTQFDDVRLDGLPVKFQKCIEKLKQQNKWNW